MSSNARNQSGTPRKQGKVVKWKDRQGFGFIQPDAGGAEVFVHIKAFPRGAKRPALGTVVTYVDARDFDGRPRAEEVRSARSSTLRSLAPLAYVIAAVFLLLVAAMALLAIVPMYVLWFYLGASALSLALYAKDKRAAQHETWRTPEDTLHLLALLGGWPGALVAQQWLRHKSGKAAFRVVFWMTAALNVAALVYLASDYGTWVTSGIDALLRRIPLFAV
jgi:uncharacterized membrane protein YsdA (DUF1294 family)/cold shock CspA family protein